MQRRIARRHALASLGGLALLLAPWSATALIEWVPIGDPGNAADPQPQGSFGSVGYEYSISELETTNSEYVSFLNAKAASDPFGLYSASMSSDPQGGILRSGVPGSYTYASKSGFEEKPVNFVTFFDALRFANWIQNGEGNGDTETGAYLLLGGTETPSNASTVERNFDAEVVVPTQDEWFKAAYYDPIATVYYDYPTSTDTPPDCGSPTSDPNHASCGIAQVTETGAYPGSPSPYGTFDQGGNMAEWNEDKFSGGRRAVRGGSWTGLITPLKASSVGSITPSIATDDRGFRLALIIPVPEPGSQTLAVAALGTVALLGWLRSERDCGSLRSGRPTAASQEVDEFGDHHAGQILGGARIRALLHAAKGFH